MVGVQLSNCAWPFGEDFNKCCPKVQNNLRGFVKARVRANDTVTSCSFQSFDVKLRLSASCYSPDRPDSMCKHVITQSFGMNNGVINTSSSGPELYGFRPDFPYKLSQFSSSNKNSGKQLPPSIQKKQSSSGLEAPTRQLL
jgi:hypothetical protein